MNPLSLIQKLVGDTTFGIMDLLRPTAKRTQRFVSILQNFWLFCNQRVAETDAVQVTARYTLNTQHSTLHTPHFTLHTPHSTLHTPCFTFYAAGECGRPSQ